MNIQMAVVCDSAMEYENRISLLGTFNTIQSPEFPVIKRQCSFALQIQWDKIEEGEHTVTFKFMDEDGRPTLKEVTTKVQVAVPAPSYFVVTNHVLSLQQVKFNKPGTYLVLAVVDERKEAEIPIQVLQEK